MEQTAVQGLLSLGVGEFEIEQAAVTFDHRQAIEFALGLAIGHRSKVTPVNLALGAGLGLKAEEGGFGFRAWAHATEIVAHNRNASVEAALFKALANDHGRDLGVDFQQALDLVCEGIELGGSDDPGSLWVGIVEILFHRWATQAKASGNLANREALMGQVVNLKDGASFNHHWLLEIGE